MAAEGLIKRAYDAVGINKRENASYSDTKQRIAMLGALSKTRM
jgi:hypothetical protein